LRRCAIKHCALNIWVHVDGDLVLTIRGSHVLVRELSLDISSHDLSLLYTPLSSDVTFSRVLHGEELSELTNKRWWAPNCIDKVIIILIWIIVLRPDGVEGICLLLPRVKHISCLVVSLKSIDAVLSWVFSKDVSLRDHVTCDSILLIITDHCSPHSIDVGRRVERTFISCKISSIIEGQWIKRSTSVSSFSNFRDLNCTEKEELPKFCHDDLGRVHVKSSSEFITVLSRKEFCKC
jgi:hypothetical protein